MATYAELAQSLYPNMPPDILALFSSEWARTGDPQVAIAEVRRSPAYEIAFPGNKRPDGTVKFDEVTYTGLKESYIGTLQEYGIPRNTSVLHRLVEKQQEQGLVLQVIWHKDYKELVLHKHKLDKSLQVLNYSYHSYKSYRHNKVLLKKKDLV